MVLGAGLREEDGTVKDGIGERMRRRWARKVKRVGQRLDGNRIHGGGGDSEVES